MRKNAVPREHGQLCLHQKKKVNLISFQKKGGWINRNTNTVTHLLILSFITWKFIPEWLRLSMS